MGNPRFAIVTTNLGFPCIVRRFGRRYVYQTGIFAGRDAHRPDRYSKHQWLDDGDEVVDDMGGWLYRICDGELVREER